MPHLKYVATRTQHRKGPSTDWNFASFVNLVNFVAPVNFVDPVSVLDLVNLVNIELFDFGRLAEPKSLADQSLGTTQILRKRTGFPWSCR